MIEALIEASFIIQRNLLGAQVLLLLEILERDAGLTAGAVRCLYSSSNSSRSASSCLSSNSLITTRRHVWPARIRAAYISLSTARSPHAVQGRVHEALHHRAHLSLGDVIERDQLVGLAAAEGSFQSNDE
jgi:hypothetical protein